MCVCARVCVCLCVKKIETESFPRYPPYRIRKYIVRGPIHIFHIENEFVVLSV